MAMTNLGEYRDFIMYQCSDGIIELWKGKGKVKSSDKFVKNKGGMDRIVTNVKTKKEAMEWVDRIKKKRSRGKTVTNQSNIS